MTLSNEKKISPGTSVATFKKDGEFFIQKQIWNETTIINKSNGRHTTKDSGWKTEKELLKSEIWKSFDSKK